MKIYDLTHTLRAETPVYPGMERPQLHTVRTVSQNGYRETLLRFFSHTGTHMDAPAHMLEDGATLDMLPPERFFGRAYVLDASPFTDRGVIRASDMPQLNGIDYLLLSTGWEKRWGNSTYFEPYPALAPDAAEVLTKLNFKGVGIDAMSIDPITSQEFPAHKILFGAGIVILENLTNLIPLRGRTLSITALPMLYENSDGAPVRVIATE